MESFFSYRSPDDDTEIEWRCFMNVIETVFTVSNLEKGPRMEPQSWRPLKEMDYDKELTKADNCLYQSGMRRLAQRVHNRRLEVRRQMKELYCVKCIENNLLMMYIFQFKPMFQDFDKPQTGLVSEDQFHRVLHTLNLANTATTSELEAIIKRFLVCTIACGKSNSWRKCRGFID